MGGWVTIGSFVFFLVLFAVVGVLSAMKKESTTDDYLLAGRKVNAWLTALSSMATNNSGYAFIGLVGFAYRFGLSSVWLTIAWIMGDMLVWMFVHKRVRQQTEVTDARSVPGLLAMDHQGGFDRVIVVIAGLLTLLFLGVYAAAQLKAGSATLNSLFGWDLSAGAIIGAVIVVLYCFSGGLRASIWTDAAQSFVMIFAMLMLVGMSLYQVGGPTGLVDNLAQQDPALAAWFPGDLKLGFALYFLGFVAGGFGAIGAPHILIRSMAIGSVEGIVQARRIYLSAFVPFVFCSALVGLFTRALMPELAIPLEPMPGADADAINAVLVAQAEQSLPRLVMELFPSILVGLTLAAIFAAIMSTADSQILSCSAALTQDIFERWRGSYLASKMATLGVTLLALVIALYAGEGVFSLVLVAWSALGATLGPILLLRLWRQPLSTGIAVAMMATGLITVVAWDQGPFGGAVFKLLPGLITPFLIYGGWRLISNRA